MCAMQGRMILDFVSFSEERRNDSFFVVFFFLITSLHSYNNLDINNSPCHPYLFTASVLAGSGESAMNFLESWAMPLPAMKTLTEKSV